jgi:hypothetical protein
MLHCIMAACLQGGLCRPQTLDQHNLEFSGFEYVNRRGVSDRRP